MRREPHVRFCERAVVRFRRATHLVVGFEHESDARRFWDAMRERLQKFSLSLHPDKTRLIEFGRLAVTNRKRRGLGKPETFAFLGFTLVCSKSRRGRFLLKRRSRRDRLKAKLKDVSNELRHRMHQSIPEQGNWLRYRLLHVPRSAYKLGCAGHLSGRGHSAMAMGPSSPESKERTNLDPNEEAGG